MRWIGQLALYLLCMIVVYGLFACGGNDDYQRLIEDLKSDSTEVRRAAIYKLHDRGKDAIPRLIAEIDDNRAVALYMHNPTSSYIHYGSGVNYSGVLSAYMIELILARDTLYQVQDPDHPSIFGARIDNYIYSNGLIVRKDGDSLEYFDMVTLRRIYEQWWQDHEQETLLQLREDWSNFDTPLAGSIYSWY